MHPQEGMNFAVRSGQRFNKSPLFTATTSHPSCADGEQIGELKPGEPQQSAATSRPHPAPGKPQITIGYVGSWGGPSNVSVVNLGTVGPTQAGTIYVTGASATNHGTFQATGGGTLNVQPTAITNFSDGTLTGGTWRVTGGSTLRAGFDSFRRSRALTWATTWSAAMVPARI